MKSYWFKIGSADPRTYTGLSPTFIQFFNQNGATLAPPSITEPFTGSGRYKFNYTSGYSTSIEFLIDADSTGLTLGSNLRYVAGNLDPVSALDLAIGYSGSSFGSTSVLPGDVLGYIKRVNEFQEGVQTFVKSSGTWDVFSRGASTLLVQKVLTNSVSGVTAL